MVSPSEIAHLQRSQYAHDMRNHFDILSLHKTERLKHYGLHFAKYVGRLARETSEQKPIEGTIVDALLITLSAANTLHQDLSKEDFFSTTKNRQVDPLRKFADAAGRFADACEKIDHLEDFVPVAREANGDILKWLVQEASERNFKLEPAVKQRREELASRHFYID